MSSILDKTFKYINSDNTDIRKTFARIKRESRKKLARAQRLRDSADDPARPALA